MLIMRIRRDLWLTIFLQLQNAVAVSLDATTCAHVCQSGECIYLPQLCDGIANCADASDESEDLCNKIRCPTHSLRCKNSDCKLSQSECEDKIDCADRSAGERWLCRAHLLQGNCNIFEILCLNGQCLPHAKLCDGNYDCLDGDDEAPALCEGALIRNTTSITPHTDAELDQLDLAMRKKVIVGNHSVINNSGCMLPISTQIIVTTVNNTVLQPGDIICNGTSVHIDCSMQHVLKGQATNFCQQTRWLHEFPYCESSNAFILNVVYMLPLAMLAAVCFLMYRRCRTRSTQRDDLIGLVQMNDLHYTAPVIV